MASELVREAIDAVAAALAHARLAVRTAGWQVGETELMDYLRDVAGLRGGFESVYLNMVGEVDSRGMPGSTEALVREATGASPGAARRDVAAARAIAAEGVLAGFGDRLAAGAVNREHVDVAVRCLDSIPEHLRCEAADREVITGALLGLVDAGSSAHDLRRAVRMILAHVDPDGTDRAPDPLAANRRFLDMYTDSTGMLVGRFQLDPVAGAAFRAAISSHSAPDPERTDEHGHITRDPRVPRQRRADALQTIAEMAMGVTQHRRGERPRIVVHTTPEQLAGLAGAGAATDESGEVLPGWVTRRLACDAVLQRVVMDPSLGPLDVGREHRLVTPGQRRALEARDGGCLICGTAPGWCDAHHVTHWADGGASDLANYALLCPRHHTAVHTGEWQIRVKERTPDDTGPPERIMLIPPRSVDPQQRPRPPVGPTVRRVVERLNVAAQSRRSASQWAPVGDDRACGLSRR